MIDTQFLSELFSVISVFSVEKVQAGDHVTFGSDYSVIRMGREQVLATVPRNNQKMALLELSQGNLALDRTVT